MRSLRHRYAVLLCMLWSMVCVYPANCVYASENTPNEYILKAAFIYNIAKFVEWPASAFENEKAPLVLCVLGKDPFSGALASIEGKTIQGRVLAIRHTERVEDLKGCHILFISASEMGKVPQILTMLKGSKILIVGDMPNFAQNGGTINLIKVENKINMEINVGSAEKAGVQISSKLLKLARIVSE